MQTKAETKTEHIVVQSWVVLKRSEIFFFSYTFNSCLVALSCYISRLLAEWITKSKMGDNDLILTEGGHGGIPDDGIGDVGKCHGCFT